MTVAYTSHICISRMTHLPCTCHCAEMCKNPNVHFHDTHSSYTYTCTQPKEHLGTHIQNISMHASTRYNECTVHSQMPLIKYPRHALFLQRTAESRSYITDPLSDKRSIFHNIIWTWTSSNNSAMRILHESL